VKCDDGGLLGFGYPYIYNSGVLKSNAGYDQGRGRLKKQQSPGHSTRPHSDTVYVCDSLDVYAALEVIRIESVADFSVVSPYRTP
jgi:hypothetical protein